jgi:hypothetical protein
MPGGTRRDCRRCGLELASQCVCSDADRYGRWASPTKWKRPRPPSGRRTNSAASHPTRAAVSRAMSSRPMRRVCVYFCLLGATTRATRHEPEPAGSPRTSWLPRREPCDHRLLLCGPCTRSGAQRLDERVQAGGGWSSHWSLRRRATIAGRGFTGHPTRAKSGR